MSDIERLEAELKRNEALKAELYKAANLDEAVNIARGKGFNISTEDLECSKELPESVMESVAGGKGPYVTKASTSAIAVGDDSSVVTDVNIDLRRKKHWME